MERDNHIYINERYDEYQFKTNRVWRVDRVYEPFVYVIKEIDTGMLYIGSRTSKYCLESDLGTLYFTSSKLIRWKERPLAYTILRIIPCASNHDAVILESSLIEEANAVQSEKYYNKSKAGKTFNQCGCEVSEKTKEKISYSLTGFKHSNETKMKMSISTSGKNHPFYNMPGPTKGIKWSNDLKKLWSELKIGEQNPFFGKMHSTETKKKISESCKGRKLSHESKQKISESRKRTKKKHCPHCDKYFAPNILARYHGDKCKFKDAIIL